LSAFVALVPIFVDAQTSPIFFTIGRCKKWFQNETTKNNLFGIVRVCERAIRPVLIRHRGRMMNLIFSSVVVVVVIVVVAAATVAATVGVGGDDADGGGLKKKTRRRRGKRQKSTFFTRPKNYILLLALLLLLPLLLLPSGGPFQNFKIFVSRFFCAFFPLPLPFVRRGEVVLLLAVLVVVVRRFRLAFNRIIIVCV